MLRDQAMLASFIDPELDFPDLESREDSVTRCDSTLVAPTTTSWAGVAGSGDVLAGLIAGILARPVRDEHALPGPNGQPQAVTPERLVSAVWLHGRAAKLATDEYNGRAPTSLTQSRKRSQPSACEAGGRSRAARSGSREILGE